MPPGDQDKSMACACLSLSLQALGQDPELALPACSHEAFTTSCTCVSRDRGDLAALDHELHAVLETQIRAPSSTDLSSVQETHLCVQGPMHMCVSVYCMQCYMCVIMWVGVYGLCSMGWCVHVAHV